MITSFEVGAVFKIINQASPELTRMLRQVRELNAVVTKARENMALLGAALPKTGITAAVTETQALAGAWRNVAVQSAAARTALTSASAAARSALPPGIGGGGGRHQPRFLARGGGGGAHIGGPGIPIPGGGHIRTGGVGMATAGMAGYAAYEAAEIEDTIWQLIYHSGQENTDANKARFRSIVQDAMRSTGFGAHDIGEAAKQEIRMFQGTPGGGIDVLPEMLKAAAIEARVKGESPEESMKALIGLAHMTKQYGPDDIKKLAPAFAFLSTANPGSLGSIEKSAGYAVPILQSSLGIDPMQSLLMGTALTRAGATSTKSGTWLREMAIRAMPGTAIFESEKKAEHHDELLKRLGLLNDAGQATWLTDGRPDLFKMLSTASAGLDKIPLTERAGVERKLFGAQGSGGLALLSDPNVREQVSSLSKEMNSPEFKNRYAGFLENYNSQVTAQSARTGMQEFNVLMQDIGQHVLPSVNVGLRNFKAVIEGLDNLLPKTPGKSGVIGGDALTGAGVGALAGGAIGLAGGPIGVLGGAAIGGVLGTAAGFMENYNDKLGIDRGGSYTSPGKTGHRAEPIVVKPAPITLNVTLDGRAIGQAVSEQQNQASQYTTDSPDFNGVSTPQ